MTNQTQTARSLAIQAVGDFWQYRWQLLGVVGLIAIPLALLSSVAGLGTDANFSAYSSFLNLIMNVALIWLIVQLVEKKPATIREAYYRGTGSLVRFLLIASLLTLMLIPFLLGGIIYINGVTGATIAASGAEKILLALVWLILALPSLWLLARFFLAIYALVSEDLRPVEALRRSNRLVRGRTGRVMLRLLVLVVVCVIVLAVPAAAVLAGAAGTAATIGLTALQLASTILVLPFASLYLYRLYRDLTRD